MSKIIKFIIIGLISLTLIVVVFSLWAVNQLKDSDAYKTAINQLSSNAEIQAATGGIESYGWYVEGFVKENSQLDSANFLLTIKGREKNVEVLCFMGKDENEQWTIKEHRVL